MAEERTQRRLAAILAADVVGYSRLMEANEAGALTALKVWRRDVLDPLAVKHQGRVFGTAGNCFLAEFGSAVSAVQCAMDLQHAMATANGDQPEGSRIAICIGVDFGAVVVDGTDLYGTCIHSAARLGAIADPGGILISGTVHDIVGTQVKTDFEALEALSLMNLAEPVQIYRTSGTPAVPWRRSDR